MPKNKTNTVFGHVPKIGGVNPMQKYSVKRALKKVVALSTGAALVGATITGALAQDLANYPAPFVESGVYDESNAFVLGRNAASSDTLGAIDIASNLQFQSKVCSSGSAGGSILVEDGVTEQVPIGREIGDSASNTLDEELTDSDISTLIDSEITFAGSNYDVAEILTWGQSNGAPEVHTSLTSGDDDFGTDVVMTFEPRTMKYYYIFDDAINLSSASSTDSLKIQFLGQTLEVTGVSSATQFTAYVAGQFFLNVGDSVEVEGKTVTLENVGSGGAIVVTVDGVQETISSGNSETVNGIEIVNDETFYEDNKDQRSATLVIGKEASESYTNDDAYVGEDEDDPDWEWNIGGLNSGLATTTSTTAEYTGTFFGVDNAFSQNDYDDAPPGPGECIDLPNNYLSICLDSLTVAEDDYMELTIEDEDTADLSDAVASLTSTGAILISSAQSEGLIIQKAGLIGGSGTDKTNAIYLHPENVTSIGVYYTDEDNSNTETLAGYLGINATNFAEIARVDFGNTKGTDVSIHARIDTGGGVIDDVNITVVPLESTDLPGAQDNITARFTVSGNTTTLGATEGTEEVTELFWGNGTVKAMGTDDEDKRTKYGIIIYNPEANGGNDKVKLSIPGDQVLANVVVKGRSSTVTGSGASDNCVVAEVTPVTLLDDEVTDPTDYNLIVVGGPCINDVVERVSFGVTCDGFRETYSEGEAVVKLANNGNNVALLVAGYSALDTQRAAKVVANSEDYALSGTEVVVSGTSLTDITVSGGSA